MLEQGALGGLYVCGEGYVCVGVLFLKRKEFDDHLYQQKSVHSKEKKQMPLFESS